MSRIFISALDLETTGFHWAKGDKIVEANLQVFEVQSRRRVINFTQLINPDGRKIDAGASKVHGITASDLLGKPLFKAVAPKIQTILERSAAVVTFNGEHFDLPFLAFEMEKAGITLPPALISFDTMKHGMTASYDSKPPSLRDFCWAMGVEYDPAKAHQAEYDVSVMMEAFFAACDFGYMDLSLVLKGQSETTRQIAA